VNYREQILATINHKEPEHVAIDLGATNSSGISAIAYSNLTKHLNLSNKQNLVYDVVQQVAQPDLGVLDLFKAGVLDVGRTFNTEKSDWYDVTLSNGETAQYPKWFRPERQQDGSWLVFDEDRECIAKMPVGATFFDQTVFPYFDDYPDNFKDLPKAMNKVHWQALPVSPFDHADEPGFWQKLRENAVNLKENSGRALMIAAGCNIFEWGTFLRRIDNFLMDIAAEPEQVERLLDALMEIHMKTLEKVCSAVGDIVDVVRICDDLGTDNGPFMNPESYRKLFKPRHKMICDYIKKHSNAKILIHSCGSIYKIMPDMIEAGIEIFNPVQTVCRDMDPVRLKKEFGKDIVFWGAGCDTRTILNHGTPEQVREHVKKNIEILAPGGGFVFNTVHNIMPDVPPENIVAMYETVHQY
jgi:uroporphyrinogen decarboxylase